LGMSPLGMMPLRKMHDLRDPIAVEHQASR
jgi:hypothetical protein